MDIRQYPQTTLDKLSLSVSCKLADNYIPRIETFTGLQQFLIDASKGQVLNFTAHHFKENHRKALNVIPGFNLIVLDIDNPVLDNAHPAMPDHPVTMYEVSQFFKNTTNIIYTSKSHKIVSKKNPFGLERFRVILPIGHFLTLSQNEYSTFIRDFITSLPFNVDVGACTDIARFWYTNNGSNFEIFVNETKFLIDAIKILNTEHTEPQITTSNNDGNDLISTVNRANGKLLPVDTIKHWLSGNKPATYDEWYKVGMALKSWDNGQRGLDIFISQSRNPNEARKKWNEINEVGGINIYHLKKRFNDNGGSETVSLSDVQSTSNTPPEVMLALSNPSESNVKRFKFLSKNKHDIESFIDEKTNNYYIVNHTLKTFSFCPKSGLGTTIALLRSYSGVNYKVSDYNKFVQIILEVYESKDDPFGYNDEAFNLYSPATIPPVAKEYTPEGLKAIKRSWAHFVFICRSEQNAFILLQWMAHLMQYPGVLMRWSPLIHGTVGMGKTYFYDLMVKILGDSNTGVVDNKAIIRDFNGWADGKLLNSIEELYLPGTNGYAAAIFLKQFITNEKISLNKKGIPEHTVLNCTNYICFSNESNPIPITNEERRYWVIEVPAQEVKPSSDYYITLFKDLKKHYKELAKWVFETEISQDFKNLTEAPKTIYMQHMIDEALQDVNGLSQVEALIERGGEWYNKECVDSACLFKELSMFEPDVRIKGNWAKNRILKKLGYSQAKGAIKIKNISRIIWIKKTMTNDEIRGNFTAHQLS